MVFSWFARGSRSRLQSVTGSSGGGGGGHSALLFTDDAYIVVPTELLPQPGGENRQELEHCGSLTLASNMHEQSQWSIYYEVLYTTRTVVPSEGRSDHSEKTNTTTNASSSPPSPPFSYLIYHSRARRDAAEMFISASSVINELEPWLLLPANNRTLLSEHLRSVMLSLKLNRAWTAAHVAARLGGVFDGYFEVTIEHQSSADHRGQNHRRRRRSSQNRNRKPRQPKHQVPPDLYTPLHLAIKQCNTETVRLLLEHHSPNLDLLNSRAHSVLHYAAVSTPAIAQLLLSAPGTSSRLSLRDSTGCTALHLACYAQKFDTLFVFLAHGLTVRQLTLSPPGSRPKVGGKRQQQSQPSQQPQQPCSLPSDADPAQSKVVTFSEQDYEDIDCADVYAGGSPLHWTRTKRLLEKLLANYRFPLNGRNSNGDTALHVAARRLRLKVVITLLCAGANVNAANIFGNSPLHLAVRENDLVVPQTLIVFDANIDARNFSNESVRHVAAKCAAQSASNNSSSSSNEAILYLLSALGAKRCPPVNTTSATILVEKEKETSKNSNPSEQPSLPKAEPSIQAETHKSSNISLNTSSKNACSLGCSSSGDFEGNRILAERLFGVDQKYDHLFKDYLFGEHIRRNVAEAERQRKEEKAKAQAKANPNPSNNNSKSSKKSSSSNETTAPKPVNMLSLDGGGIKGLISIQLLCELERQLKHPLAAYFTWFAGTSTGSFIAAFLATGMPLKAIRAHYFRLKDRVLTAEHGRPYSSEAIEAVLREIMGEQLTMGELLTVHGKWVLVPTAVANRRPMKLHLFRSYPSAEELFAEGGRADLAEQLLPDRDDDLVGVGQTGQQINATTNILGTTTISGVHHHSQQQQHQQHPNHHYPSRRMEVWKALRASGAAPGYFRAYGDFLDGGLLANNPAVDALSELQAYNAALRALSGEGSKEKNPLSTPQQQQQHRLTALVSVGTGRGLLEPTDIKQILLLLVYEVTQTEQHVCGRAEAFAAGMGAPFFRLNAFLSEMIDLDEQQEYRLINCLWEAKRYMYYRREEVKALAAYLEAVTVGTARRGGGGGGKRNGGKRWEGEL
ncbi:85/88 kDa calcium-independent phospholipase A2 [Tyrophagus putrescentiae]|nr:85/88 kDa calcium-independent phospholipase A2 [Tyrophagus putrescentiae]